MDWFLYDTEVRHERVKVNRINHYYFANFCENLVQKILVSKLSLIFPFLSMPVILTGTLVKLIVSGYTK